MPLSFPELTSYRHSSPTGPILPIHNPATGRLLTTVQTGDASTASSAVSLAASAFPAWRDLTFTQRSVHLQSCASALELHADELAELLCLENGKPVADARRFDVKFLISVFRYFASLVSTIPLGTFQDRGPIHTTVRHESYGVVVGILPFNWPPIHTGGKLAPALAAGNTVVLKPGEQAPLTVGRIVEILQGVLPEGVVGIVPGLGTEVPQALIKDPRVKVVSFTGSTAAGRKVAEAAAGNITKTLLELGGKNAIVVFDDADFDRAVRDAVDAAFFNKGEACTAGSRLIVQRGIYDRFVEKLAAAVRKIRAGDGMKSDTHIGPQVSRAQQQRVYEYIEIGKQEGARIAAQAPLPADPDCEDGFFAPATLFVDVTEDMRIAKEEMFGTIGESNSAGEKG